MPAVLVRWLHIVSLVKKRAKTSYFSSDFFAVFTLVFLLIFALKKPTFWYARKKTPFSHQKNANFFKKNEDFLEKNGDFFCVKMSELKIRQLQRRFFRLKTPWKSRYFSQNKSPFWQNKTAFYPTKTPTYFCKTPFRSTLGLKVRKHSDSVRAKASPRVSNTLHYTPRKGKSVNPLFTNTETVLRKLSNNLHD